MVCTRTVGTDEAESPTARLSSTAPNGFSSWSRAADADAATTAADLLAELDDVSFIWLWNGSRWLYYDKADGAPIRAASTSTSSESPRCCIWSAADKPDAPGAFPP